MEKQFKHNLGVTVKLVRSGEEGTVISRAEHLRAQCQYRVEYKAADGRQVDDWFDEDAVQAA